MQCKPSSSPLSAVKLNDLTAGYGSHAAIHHLIGEFARGSLTAIVGPNGSGKSTLLKAIAGLLAPMAGTCKAGRRTMAYLPQISELDRGFAARVRDLVALAEVGLEGFDKRPLDTLSGGQLQRTMFAHVLVQEAQLILLDELFDAIDDKTILDLTALITRWYAEGRTILTVAHDLALVRAHFPQTLLLARRAGA